MTGAHAFDRRASGDLTGREVVGVLGQPPPVRLPDWP